MIPHIFVSESLFVFFTWFCNVGLDTWNLSFLSIQFLMECPMADWRCMTLVFKPQLQRKLICGAKDAWIPFEKTQLNSLMNIYWHVLHFRTLVWNHNIFGVQFFQHPRCTTSCHANGTGEKHQLIEITSNPVMISPVRSLGFAIQNWWGHSFFSTFVRRLSSENRCFWQE